MKTVLRTEDFRRIESLPMRDWETCYGDLDSLSESLTSELRTSNGTMVLRGVQAAALREVSEVGGLLAAIGVGHGKTLISVLAPTILKAERPILFLPAQLKRLTVDDLLPELKKHWRIQDNLRIESYHALSNEPGLLDSYRPDLVIADECHKISHRSAARTKRILKYWDSNVSTKFIGLSGTITRKSLEDYWHFLLMSLGTGAPIPRRWYEMQTWASALDDGLPECDRRSLGALKNFYTGDLSELSGMNYKDCSRAIRRAYRDRLIGTPGVMATSEAGVDASLVIKKRCIQPDAAIMAALINLRSAWCTPDGEEITDAVDYWRKSREIATGFYYVWYWPNGKDLGWLEARSEWRRFVRRTTSRSDKYDTEMLVTDACASGKLKSSFYDNWVSIKDRARPETRTKWISDAVLEDAIDIAEGWNTIVWFEQYAAGQRLKELRPDWPIFRGGDRANHKFVVHVDLGNGPCFASIKAHSVGVNLQAYSDNIVLTPPSSGATWEQLLGRTHRSGQEADEVTFTVYLHSKEIEKDFLKATTNALYIEDSTGQKQRLNYCSIVN